MILGADIELVEVGPRDGFQAEAAFIPTRDKLRYIKALTRCGFRAMEVAAFVSMRALPQMADADELMRRLDPDLGVVWRALTPNARAAERAAAAGVGAMVALVSASESHNQANLNCSVEAQLRHVETVAAIARSAGIAVHGGVSTAFGCPFEGEVSTGRVGALVSDMASLGIEAVTLGDTTGMATPRSVTELCRRLGRQAPGVALSLHFHNTRGLALVNVAAGLAAGVRSFESAVGGLGGGCPSRQAQPETSVRKAWSTTSTRRAGRAASTWRPSAPSPAIWKPISVAAFPVRS